MFHKTEIAGFGEDEMIQHGYTQNITRLPKPFGYVHIFVRRLQISTWMIVRHDYGAGSICNGICKDFARVHYGFIDKALGYLANSIDFVPTI